MRQIQSLLEEKASRTAAQRKISSQLLQASREFQGRKMVTGVDLEPARVKADKKGVLEVDINARVTNELISQIQSEGGKIVYASRQFNAIRAELAMSKIEKIAASKEVKFIKPAVKAMTVGSGYSPAAGAPHLAGAEKTRGSSTDRKPSFAERTRRVRRALDRYMNTKILISRSLLQGW